MFELKLLSREAIPAALERAQRYRLLNEPADAESICRDILAVEPDHQQALVQLILALSEQLEEHPGANETAKQLIPRLDEEYAQVYYTGLLHERRAKAVVKRGGHGSGSIAYDGFRQAMEYFERAAGMRPPGNDEALLRWNTCARMLMDHSDLQPAVEDTFRPFLE